MEKSIFTKIITPFKTEFRGNASYIEVSTTAGIIGIYPNHIPIITTISEGILKIHPTTGEPTEFKVSGGFLRLMDNKCQITTKDITN